MEPNANFYEKIQSTGGLNEANIFYGYEKRCPFLKAIFQNNHFILQKILLLHFWNHSIGMNLKSLSGKSFQGQIPLVQFSINFRLSSQNKQ